MPTRLLIVTVSGVYARSSNAPGTTFNELLVGLVSILVVLLLVIGSGALLTLLITAVNHFLSHNAPPADVMASFNASYAASLLKSHTNMENVKNPSDDTDIDDDEIEPVGSSFDRIAKASRYVALLAAWIATCGSLFFSEALGWVPCLLCWYQRILMYPLALILAVGILRKDKGLHKYALVLSIPGACVSLYHYLYQKTDLFRGTVPCTVGVPCSSDYLNWFGGVVTIPFLALIAFLIITFCMVASRLGASESEQASGSDVSAPQQNHVLEALPVFAIIAVVVIAFLIAGISVKSGVAIAAPAETPTATQRPLPTVDSTALAHGKVLYEETCASCHGVKGEGTTAGRPLTNSQLVKTSTPEDLVKFVRIGRTANDPHNTTGLAMPANGGQAGASDADIAAVIAYVRQLAGVNLTGQ